MNSKSDFGRWHTLKHKEIAKQYESGSQQLPPLSIQSLQGNYKKQVEHEESPPNLGSIPALDHEADVAVKEDQDGYSNWGVSKAESVATSSGLAWVNGHWRKTSEGKLRRIPGTTKGMVQNAA